MIPRPLGDRIVVQKKDMQRMLPSGLVIPDTVREQSDRGEVMDIGPGHYTLDGTLVPIEGVMVGDTVVFSPYAGSQVLVDDDEFLILKVGDVLGVLPEEAPEGAAAGRVPEGATV